VTLVNWIITGVIAWTVAGTLAGILIGRIVRGREQQIPSPNHPTMRNHNTDRPLNPGEAAAWNQLHKQLR
jgi:hypothetical protein